MAAKKPVGRPLTDLGRAITAKETALARLRILQTQQLEGKLLPVDAVRWAWASAFAALRDRALGMPERVAQRGAHRPPDELRQIVLEEVTSLLEAVARGEIVPNAE